MSGTPGFRTVIFDCDSTLSAIEGIEELAVAHREEIARLTDLAMQGAVPLEEVYGRRLDLIRPSRQEVERFTGVVHREPVVRGADVTLPGPSLTDVLAIRPRGA